MGLLLSACDPSSNKQLLGTKEIQHRIENHLTFLERSGDKLVLKHERVVVATICGIRPILCETSWSVVSELTTEVKEFSDVADVLFDNF